MATTPISRTLMALNTFEPGPPRYLNVNPAKRWRVSG